MTDNLLLKIHSELVEIKALLAARPQAAAAKTYSGASSGGGGSSSPEADPPQPSEIVPNPGDVQVHFGKNNGKPLSELSERSLAWYATEQPPRLDSSGKPYPPRLQEVVLRNAARTLWHQRKGSLSGGTPDTQTEQRNAPPASSAKNLDLDENVPF